MYVYTGVSIRINKLLLINYKTICLQFYLCVVQLVQYSGVKNKGLFLQQIFRLTKYLEEKISPKNFYPRTKFFSNCSKVFENFYSPGKIMSDTLRIFHQHYIHVTILMCMHSNTLMCCKLYMFI